MDALPCETVVAARQVLGPTKPGRRLLVACERSPLPPPEAAWRADLLVGPADLSSASPGPALSEHLKDLVQELGAQLSRAHHVIVTPPLNFSRASHHCLSHDHRHDFTQFDAVSVTYNAVSSE